MHIIIIGAGPAGLAAALALSQTTIRGSAPRITILELRPKVETFGGTIMLKPLTLRYLDALGIGSRLRKLGISVRGVDVVALRTGRTLGQLFPQTDVLRVMRHHLIQCMVDAIAEMPRDRVNLRYGARVTDIQQVDGPGYDKGIVRVAVQVDDEFQESMNCDILLGCDGIHSVVRSTAVDHLRKPTYSGCAIAYGHVQGDSPTHISVTTSRGKPVLQDSTIIKGQHGLFLMTYFEPSREKVHAAATMPMAENPDAREGWKALKEDQVTIKQDILARFERGSIKGPRPIISGCDWYLYPVYMLPPGGRWRKGRVLLLGDAAHAVTEMPLQGESTGIAIEDGVLFAHALEEGIAWGVRYVMKTYEALRRDDIEELHEERILSWNAGDSYSWLWSIVIEFLTWAYLLVSNYRQKDYFKRDRLQLWPPRHLTAKGKPHSEARTGEPTWDGSPLVCTPDCGGLALRSLTPTATQTPKAIINSNYGPALTNEELYALARSLSNLDQFLLLYCQHFYQRILTGDLNPGDAAAQRLALNDLDDLETIITQIQDVKKGQSVFSSLYLKERHILYYWGRAISFLSQNLLAGDEIHQPSLGNLKRITGFAADIESALLDAGDAGVLTSDYRLVLSERWDLLESAFNLYHEHSQDPRTVARWPEIARKIQEVTKVTAQDTKAGLATQSGTFTTILWLTFVGTTLSNVWTFALAYNYSDHSPGTTKDADFWDSIKGGSSIAEAYLGTSDVASTGLHGYSTAALSGSSDGVVQLCWSYSKWDSGLYGSTAWDSFMMMGFLQGKALLVANFVEDIGHLFESIGDRVALAFPADSTLAVDGPFGSVAHVTILEKGLSGRVHDLAG
ncbi:hypothetical protein FGADI_3518 [Fusarium gaditjirri]|uniref:FAD-binding domain-containing protein n=1 Tax=Fusarium gaditjirri TaxID=282569 RepID=A0A8H4X0M2_9HYPO|nr:hypothetical protein FGADI_3518 [Fusarium gaditjirri]